ncbi:MAG TPA: peptidylprolyl isomerase [Fibrobacteria bacterium]|nr:peptidylprolyl isomerase [Fibrobacteria bacterium]HOX51408.1 peptidylprolyl isomerase [Fibrobacteria bacterium]
MLASCAREEGVVVARVGKEVLTRDQLAAMVPVDVASKANREVYLDLARRWMRTRLLAREARRMELQDDPEVRRIIRERTEEVLAQVVTDRLLDTLPEIPESALRNYYDANQVEFQREEPEITFRRIRLADQAAAQALLNKLTPATFVAEAQRLNPDPAEALEAQRFWRRSALPGALGEALFSLQEGEISEPIDLPGGGTGLFLLSSKVQAGSVRPFQDVSDLIRLKLSEEERKRRLDEALKQLSRLSGTEIITEALPGSDSAASPAKETTP